MSVTVIVCPEMRGGRPEGTPVFRAAYVPPPEPPVVPYTPFPVGTIRGPYESTSSRGPRTVVQYLVQGRSGWLPVVAAHADHGGPSGAHAYARARADEWAAWVLAQPGAKKSCNHTEGTEDA